MKASVQACRCVCVLVTLQIRITKNTKQRRSLSVWKTLKFIHGRSTFSTNPRNGNVYNMLSALSFNSALPRARQSASEMTPRIPVSEHAQSSNFRHASAIMQIVWRSTMYKRIENTRFLSVLSFLNLIVFQF